MYAVVIYESFFGNTRQIAEAIAEGMKLHCRVQCISADKVDMEVVHTAGIVVVGSATRKFQPCEKTKLFLAQLKRGQLTAERVAAFDTRIDAEAVTSRLLRFFLTVGGYAAKRIAKQLSRKSGISKPETAGFIVEDSKGPLRAGELERAAHWGEQLARNTPQKPTE